MVITIDGLGVNGKSTLAKMISTKINFKNFNTGAIYRCIALEIVNHNYDISNLDKIIDKLSNIKIDFIDEKVYLNDIDVTEKIQTEEISVKSTRWATLPEIKEIVRKIQRDFVQNNDTVMEGRDIATRIVPDAEVKFYLYSDFEKRVERLWKKDTRISIETIRNNLKIRDDLDINGGNFIKPQNAIEIDTTNLNINEVFDIMLKEIKKFVKIEGILL